MTKFTTAQLQAAIKALYMRDDADSQSAYRMVFNELCNRMGDDACMDWMDTWETQAYQNKQFATN